MRASLLTTAALAAVFPGLVYAQDRSAQPPVAAGESTRTAAGESARSSSNANAQAQTAPSTGLADIVVTAQRKSESAQRAAIAISVVGGSDLIAAGISQSNRLSQLVPALSIQSIGPSNAAFIRGVGNFAVTITSDPAVAFNYDGIYVARLTGSSTTFFDLDRVEVLKGPQGTLYGRNATAGAVNILPTQPKIGQNSGYGTISYGNYNALATEGAVNLALGDKGALRVSGEVTNRDGYQTGGTQDDKSQALRVQLKADLTPALTVRVASDYAHNGGVGGGGAFLSTYVYSPALASYVVAPTGLGAADGPLSPASQAFYQARSAGSAKRVNNPFAPIHQNNNFYGVNADIIYDTGAGILTIIPAVRFDSLNNTNPAAGLSAINDQKDRQFSVEARFAGKISIVDYTLGAFYFSESDYLRSGSLNGSSNTFNLGTSLATESYAPFGRVTINVAPRLRLVGGLRYTHDNKHFVANNSTIAVVCTVAACPTAVLPTAVSRPNQLPFAIPAASGLTVPGPVPNTNITRSDVAFDSRLANGKFTYRAAAEFDVAPASLLYASVETGFRSGSFSTAVGFETSQPETITAFTIGSKNRFFDNRVQFNIEGFYWQYRNEQVSHSGVDLLGRVAAFTQNIGRSTIKGVEVEGGFLVTPTTKLSADVQYLDARNDSFTYDLARGAAPPYTGCVVSPTTRTQAGVALNNVDCSGLPSYNSPKWTVNLAAQQTLPLGDYKLVLGADTQYKTGRFTYFDYQPGQFQPASWTTNAQVSFGPTSDRWSISGFVRNIENGRLLTSPIAFGGALFAYTTAPRTFGGRASVKF